MLNSLPTPVLSPFSFFKHSKSKCAFSFCYWVFLAPERTPYDRSTQNKRIHCATPSKFTIIIFKLHRMLNKNNNWHRLKRTHRTRFTCILQSWAYQFESYIYIVFTKIIFVFFYFLSFSYFVIIRVLFVAALVNVPLITLI